MKQADVAFQKCISPRCGATFDLRDTLVACGKCGDLLDIAYDWNRLRPPGALRDFERMWSQRHELHRFSGVWRFRELLPFAAADEVVSVGEGQTWLQPADAVATYVGMDPGRLYLQYEGMNPSGSFKDNGMTAAFTHARMVGATRAACASTGNTSASLAMYCAVTRQMKGIIFIGSGKISYGKLSQALDYGALTVQIAGDFDDAMARVKEVAKELGIRRIPVGDAFFAADTDPKWGYKPDPKFDPKSAKPPMLPDQTLRGEARLFTRLNLGMMAAVLVLMTAFFALLQFADGPHAPVFLVIVRDAIAIFGAARCMFASNFPVDGLVGGLGAGAGQGALVSAARRLGPLHVDILRPFRNLRQHGHPVRQHLHEAEGHVEIRRLLTDAVGQLAHLQRGQIRRMPGQDAHVALGGRNLHLIDRLPDQ